MSRLPVPPWPVPQIGDVLLDVDPGVPPRFRQDVAVLSAQSKQCVMLGEVVNRVVCTPNLETLLEPEQPLPQWRHAAAGAAAADKGGRRAMVVDSSEEDEMQVEEAAPAAAAAANGTQPHAAQQPAQPQQPAPRQLRQGKHLAAVAVKAEEEEEVVSPRRGGGVKSPRAGGGGAVRSPRAGLRQQRGGQKAADGGGKT